HFLTTSQKTIFQVYLHQQWETSQTQLAGTETNVKEVPSSLKTNLPQLLPPQSVSKGQNTPTVSMTMNKTCQLPILVEKQCPKIEWIILDNTSRLCTVLCSETQLLMKIRRRSDWVNLSIGNSMFKPSKTSTKLHPKLIVGSNGSLAMQ